MAFGPGDATWRRLDASVGLLRRHAWRYVSAEGALDVATGAVFIEGDGYSVSRATRSWDFGAALGGRLGLPLGRVEPWVGVALGGWLRPQIVRVAGVPGEDRLPAFEARAGLGVSVAFDP
jgi:hypothetical protein